MNAVRDTTTLNPKKLEQEERLDVDDAMQTKEGEPRDDESTNGSEVAGWKEQARNMFTTLSIKTGASRLGNSS